MDVRRKAAYRYLLYWAMLDIRPLDRQGWTWRFLNPLYLRLYLKEASRCGAVAYWMHNLAQYSSYDDFTHFSEEGFWAQFDHLIQRHGPSLNYREIFNRRLREVELADQEAL